MTGHFARCEAFGVSLSNGTVAVLVFSAAIALAQSATDKASSRESVPPDILENVPDSALVKEIQSLIGRLSYPVHAEREHVTRRLMEINAPALAQLRDAYADTEDLEVRLRIERIVHTVFFDYFVFNRNGFLGIRMQTFSSVAHKKVRVPEGRAGMYVSSVIDNTGAARAGLKPGDVIIAIDDVPLVGEGRLLQNSFGSSIRSRRPGETMTLTVIRGADELTMRATLGRTPEEAARGNRTMRVEGTTQLYHATRERFPMWWAENFRKNGDAPARSDGQ